MKDMKIFLKKKIKDKKDPIKISKFYWRRKRKMSSVLSGM